MPRIFKYGDILNITFTSDKEPNILIYRSPSYLIIYRSDTLLKWSGFFGPPCTYIHSRSPFSVPIESPSSTPVASGWVSPGAATEGVTPFFPEKKTDDFFSHHRLPVLQCHPYLFSAEKWRPFFAHHYHFCWFTRLSPPGGCHPAPFLPVRPRLSTILCKFTHKNFFRSGHPHGGCHPGRSAPPLVTPLYLGPFPSQGSSINYRMQNSIFCHTVMSVVRGSIRVCTILVSDKPPHIMLHNTVRYL